MYTIRRSEDRGHTNMGWLESWHTFSFGHYYDPRHMGFRGLRVINDDLVAPGGGFQPHSHDNMEIVSYVLEGALEHRDSMGNGSIIRAGEVQRMSAGTGVTHSEMNASAAEPVHFLQIWILPAVRGLAPGYEQVRVDMRAEPGRFVVLASGDGDGAVHINAHARMLGAWLEGGQTGVAALRAPAHHAWLHVARGSVRVLGELLHGGDGIAISGEERVEVEGVGGAEVILFDLSRAASAS